MMPGPMHNGLRGWMLPAMMDGGRSVDNSLS